MRAITPKLLNELALMALGSGGNVKNVTRSNGRSAIIDLLGNDLGHRLQKYIQILDGGPSIGNGRQPLSDDKIDLSDAIEGELLELDAISFIPVGKDIELQFG